MLAINEDLSCLEGQTASFARTIVRAGGRAVIGREGEGL